VGQAFRIMWDIALPIVQSLLIAITTVGKAFWDLAHGNFSDFLGDWKKGWDDMLDTTIKHLADAREAERQYAADTSKLFSNLKFDEHGMHVAPPTPKPGPEEGPK